MYMKGEHIWSLFQPFNQKPTDVKTMEAGFGLQKHIIAAALYCVMLPSSWSKMRRQHNLVA